jgi:hypothetical protein
MGVWEITAGNRMLSRTSVIVLVRWSATLGIGDVLTSSMPGQQEREDHHESLDKRDCNCRKSVRSE